ncbi:acyl transferase/acyl hydrolase/lysophospholipase [Dipodascopsis uninucleata]
MFFAGQGSESAGMMSTVSQAFSSITTNELNHLYTGIDDMETQETLYHLLMVSDPSEDDRKLIHRTSLAQPALLFSAIVTQRILDEYYGAPLKAEVVLGHSLGQITACVASGVISLSSGVRIVTERGRAMEDAIKFSGHMDPPDMGMFAIPVRPKGVNLSDFVADLDRRISNIFEQRNLKESEVIEIANINSPNQVVLSGHIGAIERFIQSEKIRQAKRLPVLIPFHSSLMKSTKERMERVVYDPRIEYHWPPPSGSELIRNDDALPFGSLAELQRGIIEGSWLPVNWAGSIRYIMENTPVCRWLGVGPGSSATASLVNATIGPSDNVTVEYVDPVHPSELWEDLMNSAERIGS